MTSKPATGDGYRGDQSGRIRNVCLFMATKLGDILDEIVVVGGLVPHLLIDQEHLPTELEPHVGTLDLDMGLALGIFNQERYRDLSIRLRDAGFRPDVNSQGNPTLQRWIAGTDHAVAVDFLIPPNDVTEKGGTIRHIEPDFAAVVTPGLELAFKDQTKRQLSGYVPSGAWVTRGIPVCGPGAFTVLKALAFRNRTENKDAYDLFYVWNGIGVGQVATDLMSLLPDPHVEEALTIIRQDFSTHDGPGPVGTAEFMTRGANEEIQADVTGQALALLRSMGS